jgi:hypothetical protein
MLTILKIISWMKIKWKCPKAKVEDKTKEKIIERLKIITSYSKMKIKSMTNNPN